MNKLSWDDYFIGICKAVAAKSKDESTQLGSVIVGPNREIRATGYNSFPRGIRDDLPERQERPLKYLYMEHAERNALYNADLAGTCTEGCVIYIPRWVPCADCARGIINAGIREVVLYDWEFPERWTESFKAAVAMMTEKRPEPVNIRLANRDESFNEELLAFLSDGRPAGADRALRWRYMMREGWSRGYRTAYGAGIDAASGKRTSWQPGRQIILHRTHPDSLDEVVVSPPWPSATPEEYDRFVRTVIEENSKANGDKKRKEPA